LPVVETAAVVIDARLGVQTVTHRMMDTAKAHDICRLLIVNKMDADDVDLTALLADITKAFGGQCLPMNLPADRGSRVVDCFLSPSVDATDILDASAAHVKIVNQAVEMDEALMEACLEGAKILRQSAYTMRSNSPYAKAT
jgi:elongation factor G